MGGMAEKRRYSDEERAAALAALAGNGGNLGRTARELGIPAGTLRRWADGTAHPEARANAQPKKEELAQELRAVAWKLVKSMPGKIKKAGLKDTAISFGIAVEKAQLLEGKPTSISGVPFPFDLEKLTDEQLDQLDAILAAAGLPAAD